MGNPKPLSEGMVYNIGHVPYNFLKSHKILNSESHLASMISNKDC